MSQDFWSNTLSALTQPKAAFVGAPLIAVAAAAAMFVGADQPAQATITSAATTKPQIETPSAPPTAVVTPVKAGDAKAAASGTPDKAAIESIVRAYLLQNPEILVEMSEELERRRTKLEAVQHENVIIENKATLFRSDLDYVFGNPDGDVSVIEFFDYNCAWCKRALDQVQQLVDQDKKVRVVMKEMPIFGEHSTYAAKAAMASKKQGKYWEFHVALMKQQRVSKDNVLTIAADVGIDVERLKKDMQDPAYDAAIADTMRIAEALKIQGTPGFIVDTKVNVGFVPG
ncbi:MAG: DsbA family protein [Pseudomonadota bacterium]